MEEEIVLTGIARSKGKVAGEALVNRQRMGWAFNHVSNEAGIVTVPGPDIDISGCIAGEIPAVDGLDQDPITTMKFVRTP